MRVGEAALLPEPLPGPETIVDMGGQWKAELVREHAGLSAVMRIVGEHVGEHSNAGRPGAGPGIAAESFDAAG